MFFATLPFTTEGVLMLRLRLLLFFESMWLPNARSRTTLPVGVTFTRLAVALCVFIFGIYLLLTVILRLRPAI